MSPDIVHPLGLFAGINPYNVVCVFSIESSTVVSATTRVLYQKKLLNILSNGEVKWSKHPEKEKTYDREVDLEEDEYYDSDEEDEGNLSLI